MLDDFSLEQNITYKIMINSIKKNKLSHAFIIESNGYSKSLDLAKSFAKYLLCPNNYSNNKKCDNCHQCQNIDKNEFIELKIIEPDGQWIKKSQLEELQELFSKKSLIGNKKIYIINHAEKLNLSSSNSILKFLEEPEEGIIAILITESASQLLSTIVSRCQVLSLKNRKKYTNLSTIEKIAHHLLDNEGDINDYINNEENTEKFKKVIEFIEYYEKNKLNTLIYINNLWLNYFKEREELSNSFEILLLFYKDVLNIKLNRNVEIFNDYLENINNISKSNTLDELSSKINVIINLKEKIKFNANSNLLMDKLVIGLEGCEEK